MKKVEYVGLNKELVDSYDKTNHKIWNSTEGQIVEVRKFVRDHYLQEQGYRCAYCRIEKKEGHGMSWDVEHVLSKSLFPLFLFEPLNLVVACKECNTAKDDTNVLVKPKQRLTAYPSDKDSYTIVHPHLDTYSDHFEIIVVGKRRSYRMLNKHKARTTYLVCNLSRFDYQYAEWDDFDAEIVSQFSDFLDHCPKDATPDEVKRMLGHLRFVQKADFT